MQLIILIAIGIAIIGWQLRPGPGRRATTPPLPLAPTGEPAKPLQPPPAYLDAALRFLNAWSKNDVAASYGLLSAGMKKAATQAAWAEMMPGAVFENPQPVAHVGVVNAAYVICRVQAQPRPRGEPALSGFALLMVKEKDDWKVGSVAEQEQIMQKYADLRLSPGTKSGWTVTYQDEKGLVVTLELPAL
jgi:hypothetical protein